MSRTSLVDDLVESVLDRILRGVFAVQEMLPPEAVLAEEAGVSRLTAREAIKTGGRGDVNGDLPRIGGGTARRPGMVDQHPDVGGRPVQLQLRGAGAARQQ
ncbi:GntR family transcriptional regulator [Cryobacterium sp. Hh7]|uniref:GntR family transcriptional regulator n=1 Tax=Cryobacterium sp. Hh7 TaxID=1259159 RepID=UPI00351A3A05